MKFWKKLENLFAATAFAEEGEFDTARQMTGQGCRRDAEVTGSAAGETEIGKAKAASRRKGSRGSRSRAA